LGVRPIALDRLHRVIRIAWVIFINVIAAGEGGGGVIPQQQEGPWINVTEVDD
jgi:hypothetical protein